MNRIIKKLIKDSIVIRNCSILQKYNVIQSYAYFSADALAYKANRTDKVDLSEIINEIQSTVTNSVQAHKTINLQDAIQMVYKLGVVSENKKLHYQELKEIKEIKYLFEVIQANFKFLSIYHIICILKILVMWNVPHNTMLVQTLLQLICASVNNLSIKQILLVQNTLYKMKSCPLSTSLHIALKLVFKQKTNDELFSDDTNYIVALMIASINADKQKIEQIIKNLIKKPSKLKISHMVNLYSVLYNMPERDYTKKLLFHMKNIIKKNINDLTVNEITLILRYICKSYLNNTMKLYDETLIHFLYSSTFKKNITFRENISILRSLNAMHYSCADLLNNLTETCIKNRSNIDKSPLEDIISFIEGLVIAEYKEKNWQLLQMNLVNYAMNVDCSLQTAISISFSLLSLDCFDLKLLQKTFSLYNKLTIFNSKITLDILKLYWCAKLLYSAPNDLLLNKSKLKEVQIRPKEDHISCLMESLKEACGSDKYIKSGLKTKWGLLVDNIIVRQPDGSLMDISNYDNITFIEQLAFLSKYDKIVFIAPEKEAYSINMRHMLPTMKIQLRAIEKLPGYHVFVVDPFSWKQLSRERKVADLKQAITKNYSNTFDI